jgi:hypothetical protein
MGLKIEREKAALMHVNKKSATLMRATKASDKSRLMLEVSDEKVSVVGKVLCERAYRKIKKTKEGDFDVNQQVLCERAYRKMKEDEGRWL